MSMGNRFDLQRIGHNDAPDKRRQHADHSHRVAGRLDNDLVLFAEGVAKTLQPRAGHADASSRTQLSRFPEHHFSKGSVDVHANHTSHYLLLSFIAMGAVGDTTTTDPRSRRNRVSRRGASY